MCYTFCQGCLLVSVVPLDVIVGCNASYLYSSAESCMKLFSLVTVGEAESSHLSLVCGLQC